VENQLVIQKKTINKIIQFEKKKRELESKYKELKDKLHEAMSEAGITKFETAELTINDIDDTIVETFDKERFKEDNPEAYKNYIKKSYRKGFVKIKVEKSEDNE
jgi:regulator of replication initiation timing